MARARLTCITSFFLTFARSPARPPAYSSLLHLAWLGRRADAHNSRPAGRRTQPLKVILPARPVTRAVIIKCYYMAARLAHPSDILAEQSLTCERLSGDTTLARPAAAASGRISDCVVNFRSLLFHCSTDWWKENVSCNYFGMLSIGGTRQTDF